MSYVDCFVAAVPRANRDAYVAFSKQAGAIFLEHGALKLTECWGDDVPLGKLTSFPRAVHCADGEEVTISMITWPSKAARDAGMAKIRNDERMQAMTMPFDGQRALVGGFNVILEN